MKKQRFCREYVGERLFVLCDDDMEYAAEQQKLPYDMMEAIFESLDKNHAIPKETVTKYGKLLKRIPLWQEAEMAYEVGRLHNGVLKEYYDYRPEAVAVEEAWDEIDGLLDGQLIEVAAEVKRKKEVQRKKETGKLRDLVVPILQTYSQKAEIAMEITDYADGCSFTVVLSGANGFSCDLSDHLSRTVLLLASRIDVIFPMLEQSMRLELTYIVHDEKNRYGDRQKSNGRTAEKAVTGAWHESSRSAETSGS